MIEVKNLVKDYGKHHAVKDISFSVPDGQIVVELSMDLVVDLTHGAADLEQCRTGIVI